ncbi:protein-tyrosine phosphatase-like protein, partial [Parasitella parasitica]
AAIEKGTLNRYTNIWPFEYTRVKLDNKENDYINASYIQYIDYISTQGPLPTTFEDFWTVVWNENSRVIVMLTKEEEMSRIKCHRYWPTEIESIKTFGQITVKFISETEQMSKSLPGSQNDVEESLILRHFEISKNNQEPKLIQHLQYRGWQDYGVPDNPLGTLELVALAQEWHSKFGHNADLGPMIVHCSAGCGRTGAFCTIDTLITRLSSDSYLTREEQAGELDPVYQTVSKFREQRMSMVQTLRQYVFCYEAILWWI